FSNANSSVRVYARTMTDHGVRIAVEDDGCGIPQDELTAVMEPFGQVRDPRYYSGKGTGLGLPLARAMAELHGAHLWLESREGVGTKVYLEFPPERTLPSSRA